MYFNDVRLSGKTQFERPEQDRVFYPYTVPHFMLGPINTIMLQSAFSRKPVFAPLLLNVNKRTLPRAESLMLQSRQRDQIVL